LPLMTVKSLASWNPVVGSNAGYDVIAALVGPPVIESTICPGTRVCILMPRLGPSNVGVWVFVTADRLKVALKALIMVGLTTQAWPNTAEFTRSSAPEEVMDRGFTPS